MFLAVVGRAFLADKSIQMEDGGEWENEIWPDLRAERRIALQFQGAGAHPWHLERRNGLARGV